MKPNMCKVAGLKPKCRFAFVFMNLAGSWTRRLNLKILVRREIMLRYGVKTVPLIVVLRGKCAGGSWGYGGNVYSKSNFVYDVPSGRVR